MAAVENFNLRTDLPEIGASHVRDCITLLLLLETKIRATQRDKLRCSE